jgi:FkbM family methyltransferase
LTPLTPTRPIKSLTHQLLFETVDQLTEARAFCVQVGANDGVTADPLNPYLTKRGWGGLLLEPSPLYFERLARLHAGNDRVEVLNTGCSSRKGSLPLYYLDAAHEEKYRRNARGTASLDRAWLEAALSKQADVYDPSHISEAEVPLDRLDAILAKAGVDTADVLVIDVEGHEAEVMEGVDLAALDPLLTRVECSDRARARALAPMLAAGGGSVYKVAAEMIALSPRMREAVAIDTVLQTLGFEPYSEVALA